MSTQLLVGGRIYSPSAPDATAMAVTDGVVVWVGEDRPGRALHPGAQVIELDGAFVTPGFVDAHVHVTALGLQLTGLDLGGVRDKTECLDRVRRFASEHDGPVVWGHGWDDSRWPDAAPTTAELDEAAPGRSVYLTRADAHSALCSTPLRQETPSLASAPGYTPDGALTGEAHHSVRARARALLTPTQRAHARVAALDHAAAQGIVAVHECGGPDISGLDDFRDLLAAVHRVEVRGYWGEAVDSPEAATELLARSGAHALGGDLFIDGALGSRTAAVLVPYHDCAGHRGTTYLDTDTVAAHVRACTLAGIQAGFHAIGDAAVAAALTAFGTVAEELGGPALAARGHRIEHLEMVTPEQAAQLGSWGVIASMQPVFDRLWGGPDGMYAQRLGAERAARMNPFAPIAATGMSLAFGSDAPVTPIDPWAMLRAAVHHRTPGSGVSPRAAFAAATRGAWRAGGVRDGMAGSLIPGAPASYAIWDADELVVSAPRDSVQRWSTDPRSRVPALPRLDDDARAPVCLKSVHRGVTVHERGVTVHEH
ncbi:amidohydrolase [Rhodococcus xishaensis]|uniref:Amidohydrolase n=1 Tax=Rhodococcus xishaensis TaxID=2487364 RepID=A0A3S3BLK1_9NOCA|nr:amidohydrolase [Rhodococcus xishaensis]RVW04204.1 amidohydrolase [Rhodococcus xishaensis]